MVGVRRGGLRKLVHPTCDQLRARTKVPATPEGHALEATYDPVVIL
jgi:hypothetical protein